MNEWRSEVLLKKMKEIKNINRLASNDFIRPGISGRDFVIDLMHQNIRHIFIRFDFVNEEKKKVTVIGAGLTKAQA